MSRAILFLILSISFYVNNECHIRFNDFFNYSVPELIEYDYRALPYDMMNTRFFIIHEIEYDTINCNLEFIFDHCFSHNELKELIGNYYFTIDSNIVVLTSPSINIFKIIEESTMQINDSLISIYRTKMYIEDPNVVTTGNDIWITAKYNDGKALISICGDNKPIILLPEHRE